MAALMCSEGARLLTDDLLRTDFSTGQPRCYLGSVENRLRFVPSELGLANSGQGVPRTVDERVLHRPAAGTELCPLVGVVSPVPDRSASQLDLVRLDAGTAVMELTANLNVRGWRDVSRQRAAFVYVSRFAAVVPVYRARIPWGPPFRPDVTRALMEQTGLAVAR